LQTPEEAPKYAEATHSAEAYQPNWTQKEKGFA
jgi:hypothetical protein